MSETGVGASSTEPESGLVDETGSRIRSDRTTSDLEPIVRFSCEQPLATALLALLIGYVLGKSL